MRCAYTIILRALTIRRHPYVAILIHRSPEVVAASLDPEKILRQGATLIHRLPEVIEASFDLEKCSVNVPPVAGLRRLAAQAVGVRLAKLEAPLSDGLVRDCYTAPR